MAEKNDEPKDDHELVQFKLRMKEGLRAQIEAVAKANGNSMNSEIAARLDASLQDDALFGSAENKRALLVMARDIAEVERLSGKSWRNDLATARAIARVLADTIKRFEPRLPNYDEAISFLQEVGDEEKRRQDLHTVLLEVGALRFVQPNALALIASGSGPSKPYPVLEENEDKWHHPSRPSELLSDEEKADVRKLIAELKEINDRQPERAQKLEELRRPMIEADKQAEVLHQQYRHSIEAMIENALRQSNGA